MRLRLGCNRWRGLWTRAVAAFAAAIIMIASVRVRGAELPRTVRIQIEASEDVSSLFPGAPRLQSFAWAQWDGKWIFLGGRTGGYHGIGQGDVDFPRSRANLKIWVVVPSESGPARTYGFSVADLPAGPPTVQGSRGSDNPPARPEWR